MASKYRNRRCSHFGHTFDSIKEGDRFLVLRQDEIDGEISGLELQPKFTFELCGVKICTYKADFKYTTRQGDEIIEDVKGYKTDVYKLKKKLMKAFYGIEVYET